MFFICKDDKVSQDLARKFSENAKPGAIIPLTEEELEAYKDFQIVSTMDCESSLIEVKPDTMYLMTVSSSKANIEDCVIFCEQAKKIVNAKINIIRTKD
jgi:hypothetical protein